NLESLLYIANMASIPLHIWGSRISSLEQPDWCILDLDPKEAPFQHVVTIARATKSLCDDIGLPCFIKTSGSTGLHVLLPLGRQCTYEQARTLGGLLARVIAAELPDIATITRQVERRGARVYLDYVQNGHGRLLVAPSRGSPRCDINSHRWSGAHGGPIPRPSRRRRCGRQWRKRPASRRICRSWRAASRSVAG